MLLLLLLPLPLMLLLLLLTIVDYISIGQFMTSKSSSRVHRSKGRTLRL